MDTELYRASCNKGNTVNCRGAVGSVASMGSVRRHKRGDANMGKVTELFGIICIVGFVIIGMLAVGGLFVDGLHRTIIHFVTDNLFFASKYVYRG